MTPPKQLYWGKGTAAPGEYLHRCPAGARVPGWEDVDVKRLAVSVGVHYRFLLYVLTGKRNCTLDFLLRVSRHLGVGPGDLICRIERAYHMGQDGTQ